MQGENLLQLFLHELSVMHDAERRLTRLLSTMAGEIAEPAVRRALAAHAAETERQVAKLERCFAALRATPQPIAGEAMAGIEADHDTFVRDVNPAHDALLAYVLAAASRIEHFEAAAYTALVDLATLLDRPDAATLLAEIRREEIAARDAIETLRAENNRRAEAHAVRELATEHVRMPTGRPVNPSPGPEQSPGHQLEP
ncbi:MAG TPA: DUF892 family protein [Gemmatimonadaceae bacterium]|nr:DUF892 family protein [Gemmatimonadaceae bacterium]